jgi:hypothetical protein
VLDEGHLATGPGTEPVPPGLTAEAIRLTRLIRALTAEARCSGRFSAEFPGAVSDRGNGVRSRGETPTGASEAKGTTLVKLTTMIEGLFPGSGSDLAPDLGGSRVDSTGVTIQIHRPAGRPQYATD